MRSRPVVFHRKSNDEVSLPQHQTQKRILRIRCGSMEDNDSDFSDDSSDGEEDDDTSFLFDQEEDLFSDTSSSLRDQDFMEESTLDRFMASWEKTPLLTKAYVSSSIALTVLGYLSNKNKDFPPIFQLEWKPTLYQLQLWRPITAFLNFGSFGLGYLMTIQFVWTYMSTLERLNHDTPFDFWYMIFFGCLSMIVGYGVLRLPPRFLGHNLSTFLVYVWSRYHEGFEVNVMELFNTKAEMLPWFFLAQTALFEGEFPILDLLGIVFGHVYYHFKVVNALVTPKFIVDWYRKGEGKVAVYVRNKYKEISTDFELVQ